MDLVRQVAETLAYAHSRRLYHRALSPQTILVTSPDGPRIRVQVFDWQSARRDETTHTGKRLTVEDTVRIGLSGDRQSAAYLAPELASIGAFDPAKMDIFSLGAIAYHVFSGQPPAGSVEELHQKLADASNAPGPSYRGCEPTTLIHASPCGCRSRRPTCATSASWAATSRRSCTGCARSPKHFQAIARTLRSIVPSVEDLTVDLDRRPGTLDILIRQGGIDYSSRIVSEGTLCVLALGDRDR